MNILKKPKQVRFAQLIKASGRPHPATLWVTDPIQDRGFKKALEENRIVTVRTSNTGTKADRGVIGFLQSPNSTYLIFPKALPMAEGTGVIGLKFDELSEPEVKDPVKVKTAPRSSKVERVKTVKDEEPEEDVEVEPKKAEVKKSKPQTSKEPAKESTYEVTIQFNATATREFKVKAASATVAIELALNEAKSAAPKKVDWSHEALTVKKKG